jgi:Kef-type K+ transport system membrane component KefB
MRLLLVLILAGLMHAARSFAPDTVIGGGAAGTALACGYLLLSAFLMGAIFKSLRLPRLTGYLVTGIVVGPQLLNLVSGAMVSNLQIFTGTATALIALTAGIELDLRAMKPLLKSIGWLTLIAVCGTIVLISLAVFGLRRELPFFHDLTTIQVVAMSAVLGVTMVAQSPAVVVALHSEMESDGPLTRTVLGVVVLSDLLVIVLFAIVSSITKSFLGSGSDALHTAGALAWEVIGSVVIGTLVGIVVAIYLKYVKGSSALFVITAAFVIAEVGQRIDLDPLLVALAAGVFIRNFTHQGDRLQDEIEKSSLPVYVVFFAVTGATIHIHDLLILGLPAIILVGIRMSGFLGLGWVSTRIARATDNVRKYIGLGLMPQAGLALALALLFVKTFPKLGAGAAALVFGCVAINEMLAPVLYRYALVKTGEAGQATRLPAEEPAQVTASN